MPTLPSNARQSRSIGTRTEAAADPVPVPTQSATNGVPVPCANGNGMVATTPEAVEQLLPDTHPFHREAELLLAERFALRWYARCKFVSEWIVGLVLFVLLAPVTLLSMLLVRLTSPGPAIYSQVRIGRDGKPFTIYKLRSMRHNCESVSGAKWSTPGDSRITPIGSFLRKTHLDELPQLWNVLRGEMGLVGPRPERPEFVPKLAEVIPLYRCRLLVRPGVTGLAQVQLPPDTSLDSVRVKLAYDLHYLQNVGLWLDLRVVAATGCKLFCLPFATIGRLMGFAKHQRILEDYEKLISDSPKVGHD